MVLLHGEFCFCFPHAVQQDLKGGPSFFYLFFFPHHCRLCFCTMKDSFGTFLRRTQRTVQKLCNSIVTIDCNYMLCTVQCKMWVIQAICIFSTTLLNLKIANYMEIRLRIKWVTSHTVLLQHIISRSLSLLWSSMLFFR